MQNLKKMLLQLLLCIAACSLCAQGGGVYSTVQPLDSFDSVDSWWAGGDHHGPQTAIHLAGEPAKVGTSLELAYDFVGSTGSLNYCEYTKKILLPKEATHLSFWVYGDGSGHLLRVRLQDLQGEWFQYTVKNLDFGWEQMYVDLQKPDQNWGGDGKLDWPLTFNSVVIDSKSSSFVGRGSIYLDELEAAVSISAKPLFEGFEADPPHWQVRAPRGTAQIEAASHSYSGSRSLKIEYTQFRGSAIHLTPDLPYHLEGAPLHFGLRALGAIDQLFLVLKDGEGKSFKLNLGQSYPGQWQALTSSWEAVIAEDQKVVLPLLLTELIIYPTTEEGTIYIDHLFGESLLSQFQVDPLAGAKINYHLSYEGTTEATLELRVKGSDVTDSFHKVIRNQSDTLLLRGQKPGSYIFEAWCLCGKVEILLSQLDFAVLAPSPKIGNKAVGVQTHYAQGKGKLPDNLELAQFAGVGFIRDEIYWSSIELEKGVYTFPPEYDAYIQEALRLGLEPLTILDYGNSLHGGGAPTTKEELAAWRGYVRAVVERYPEVRHWEIWNEFNGGMGLTPGQQLWTAEEKAQYYVAILREAAAVIREVAPEATIVGCATAGVDLEFIEAVLAFGGLAWMDAISIHPYCYPSSPTTADLLRQVKLVEELVAKHGGTQPIWITEIGWPTHTSQRGVSPKTQALYLAQMYTQLLASGTVEKIFWYDLQDDGTDPTYNEHNFGLVRTDLTPKPGYTALAMISRSLCGSTEAETIAQGENGLWHYHFTTPSGVVQILWIDGEEQAFSLPQGFYRVTTLSGEISTIAAREGSQLTLGAAPVIIETVGEDQREPREGVRVELGANPLPLGKELVVRLSGAEIMEKITFRIYNLAGKELGGGEVGPYARQVEINWEGGLLRGAYLLWLQVQLITGEIVNKKELFLIL